MLNKKESKTNTQEIIFVVYAIQDEFFVYLSTAPIICKIYMKM